MREELRDKFARSLERLDRCCQRYAELDLTSPLLAALYPLSDPLQAHEPLHWFPGVVSHLSCLLFDSAGPALVSLGKYRYAPDIEDLVCRDDWFLDTHRHFTDLLRDLRTTMQHGMRRVTPRNAKIRDQVSSWYRLVCGQAEPDLTYARTLTVHLMNAFERYIDDLEGVLRHLGTARSSAQVWAQVERDARSLDRGTFFQISHAATERIDPRVTVNEKFGKKIPGQAPQGARHCLPRGGGYAGQSPTAYRRVRCRRVKNLPSQRPMAHRPVCTRRTQPGAALFRVETLLGFHAVT